MELEIKDLVFGYKNCEPTLNGISLDAVGPQLISIVGPNGVGKSTFIHCLNKILEPSGGIVMIDGESVADYSIRDLAKKMSYVPNASSDSFPMTVLDTILMGRNPHSGKHVTKNDIDLAYNIMKELEITDLAMRPFNELSAGQHQKVAIARGLAQQPKIFMLDEPTSNLDIKHQMDVTRLLKKKTLTEDMMVVMISHDLNIAAKYSDHVIMLSERHIYSIGTPAEVFTEDNIMHVYGVPSKILMDGGRPYIMVTDHADLADAPSSSTCRLTQQRNDSTMTK